jgi:hypothetical protein
LSVAQIVIENLKEIVDYVSEKEENKIIGKIEKLENHISEINKKLDFLVTTKIKEIEEKRKPFETIYKILLDKIVMSWNEACKIYTSIQKKPSIRFDFLNFCKIKNIKIVELPTKGRPKFLILVLEGFGEAWLKKLIEEWDKITNTGLLLNNYSNDERGQIKNFLLKNFGFYFTYMGGDHPAIIPKKRLIKKK